MSPSVTRPKLVASISPYAPPIPQYRRPRCRPGFITSDHLRPQDNWRLGHGAAFRALGPSPVRLYSLPTLPYPPTRPPQATRRPTSPFLCRPPPLPWPVANGQQEVFTGPFARPSPENQTGKAFFLSPLTSMNLALSVWFGWKPF